MKKLTTLPPFNFAYQLQRHFDVHMRQWPKSNPDEVMADISRRLNDGDAWLWPEPGSLRVPEPRQLELFFSEAVP